MLPSRPHPAIATTDGGPRSPRNQTPGRLSVSPPAPPRRDTDRRFGDPGGPTASPPICITFPHRARRPGAPEQPWRITTASMPIAAMLRAVSRSVSSFVTLDVATSKLTTVAPRRRSASSNDVRVRVLGSKKRLTMVLPRRSDVAQPPSAVLLAPPVVTAEGGCAAEAVGHVEHAGDFLGRVVLQPEQMPLCPFHGGAAPKVWRACLHAGSLRVADYTTARCGVQWRFVPPSAIIKAAGAAWPIRIA